MIIIVLALGFGQARAQELYLRDTVIQYDTIARGSAGKRYLTIWNVGDAPLVVEGCSGNGPSYPPREPIMPGDSARIGVLYDTQRLGRFNKAFWFTTNCVRRAGRSQIFYIRGYVR